MKKIGFIPLRKGSKGIPNKNRRKMVGRPLFTWVLGEAIFSSLDKVYIYTDDQEIIDFVEAEYKWTNKVEALLRSNESATDEASTEFAIFEFCEKINYDFDVFCLLQATSPLTTSADINACLEKVEEEKYDSALTVVNTHRFIWSKDGKAINYDVKNRPRRQNFDGLLIENGAVYTIEKAALKECKNRIGVSTAIVEMPEESFLEIDSLADWIAIEQLLIRRQKENKGNGAITHFVLDVDGVFTDGKVLYGENGELAKQFSMRDGMGLEILRENGVEVIVMTSENSMLVNERMKKLKIQNAHLGVKDKFTKLRSILERESLKMNNVAYMGDDVNDLANMCSAGWSIAPNNAMPQIKQNADLVLDKSSSEEAIRSACEFIINYNNRY